MHAKRVFGGYPATTTKVPMLAPKLGQVQVRLAATGHGKTSDSYSVVPALAASGPVLFLHTEEETVDKLTALNIFPGRPNAHVAANVQVRKTLPFSVADLVTTVFRTMKASLRTGRPLPVALVIDYVDGFHQFSTVESARQTFDLLGALARFDIAAVSEMTGVMYDDRPGARIPELEGAEMAVIAYSNGSWLPNMRQRPSADTTLSMFVAAMSDANVPEMILFERDEPWQNRPVVGDDGRTHLSDNRGAVWAVAPGAPPVRCPMRFDIDPDGFRARWFDAT
jgi:hypothetical protein